MARVMEIVTPLGGDVLLFKSMRSREALGRLFEYTVTALSTRNDIDPKQLLGKNATLKLQLPGGGPRCFDGMVTRFALAGSHGRFVRYEMVLRPWLWFLTRTADCRIFQEKTVPDIIKDIFAKPVYPDASYEFKITGTYDPWEYCVQYRETDFNFVSRLMEQEGMYYYFKHTEGKHTMVICDSPGVHEPFATYTNIPFVADNRSTSTERERISDWYYSAEVQPGKYVIDEYDFKKPSVDLMQKTQNEREHEHGKHEIFDYPGEYDEIPEGDRYVRMRLEELQAQHERVRATSNARGICVGHTFALVGHPRGDQNKQYMITSADISFSFNEYESAGNSGASYSCSFECMPSSEQFRTARETPKPIVQGLQTAKVVGPDGEEIYTDEYGRVKVHFHWDRYGQQNQDDTCWIRVSHPWAGKNFGMVALPRMGQEVVVEFLEGDPDRPLITGRVYNKEQPHPYDLPKHKTTTGIKSRSSLGGTPSNFNEIRFEDKKGEEQVYIHAERNMSTVVEANRSTTVGHDRMTRIGNNDMLMVQNDRTEIFGANHSTTVGGNQTLSVSGSQDTTVAGDRSVTVGASQSISIGADQNATIGGSETYAVSSSQTNSVGQNKTDFVGVQHSELIGAKKTTVVGGMYVTNAGAISSHSSAIYKTAGTVLVQCNAAVRKSFVTGLDKLTVGGARTEKIGGALSTDVGGARKATIAGADSLDVVGARSTKIGGVDSLSVGGAVSISAGAAMSFSAGAAVSVSASGAVTIQAASVTITAGAITLAAGAVSVLGVLNVAGAVITPSVVSASYTPGVGNIV
ncbi:MAG: type VI secretion system tip protein VgrG [Thermomicrobiales bacterium]|nr:MAG: type VI secretion system tip protein VgrG [Thermomicrobiales bacterium]